MRCHYMSDLHLESQDFPWGLPKGEVLILAGDLCHASCLDPARQDLYAVRQRERVQRFAEAATKNFAHVLLIAGNHDHYDGLLEETIPTLRRHLTGFTVLDDEAVEIGGISFFGTTLWSDFEGGAEASIARARKGVGEYFFVRTNTRPPERNGKAAKLTPEATLAAHKKALDALDTFHSSLGGRTGIIITHHAPSRLGMNAAFQGNGLDGAYGSDLDARIAALSSVPVWVHGHTHITRRYKIGNTRVLANCRGFDGKDRSTRNFNVAESFEV